jgi:O-antigen/teichoic acid export membrane protein
MQHTDAARSFGRASGILLIGQFAYYAIYLVSIRTILSTLPKAENGVLTLVQQWAAAAFSITMMNGYNTLIVHRLRAEPSHTALFSTLIWLRSGIALGTAAAVAACLSAIGDVPVSISLVGVAATVVLSRGMALRTTLELPLQSQMRFGSIAALSILDVLLLAALLVASQANLNAASVLTLQLVSALPSFILLAVLAVRAGMIRILFDRCTLGSLFRTARPLGFLALFLSLHTMLDLAILRLAGTPTMVGVFGASSYAALPANVLMGIVWSPLVPLLSKKLHGDRIAAIEHAGEALRLATATIGIIACVVAGGAPLVVELLTRGAYRDHIGIFALQSWLGMLTATVFAVQHLGTLLEQYRIATATVAMLALGSLLFDWWLVAAWGAEGIVLAKAASHLLAISYAYWRFTRIGMLALARMLARLMFWSLLAGGAIVFALQQTTWFVHGAVAIVGVIGSAALLGIIRWSDRALLQRMLPFHPSA